MSIKWMTTVWDEALDVKGTPLLVLLVLADHAQDDTGAAWPSVERIMKRSRWKRRAVQKALDELERKGWIRREFRTGHSTVYHLCTPAPSCTPSEVTPVHDGAPTHAPSDTPPMHPGAPITIKEPSISSSASSAFTYSKGAPEKPQEAQTTAEGVADEPKPESLPIPAAAFLRELLPNADAAIVKGWTLTWQAMKAMQVEDSPVTAINVILEYLAWCRQTNVAPVSTKPVEWLARKEREHQEALAAAPKQDDDAEGEEWERMILRRRPVPRDWEAETKALQAMKPRD